MLVFVQQVSVSHTYCSDLVGASEKGRVLADRLQSSDAGCALLAQCGAAIAKATTEN